MTTKVVENEKKTNINSANKTRKKSEESIPFLTEEHEILDGKAKVLRTRDSGDIYQLRIWVPQKKKYIRC